MARRTAAAPIARTRDNALALIIAVGLPAAVTTLLGAAYFATNTANAALPTVPVPTENPITEEKRVLGKILFWDEQLSSSNAVACATCHAPRAGGGDPRIAGANAARNPGFDGVFNTPDDIIASPGIIRSDENNDYLRDATFAFNPQITDRTAPTMINAAFAPNLFWDGRASSTFRDPITNEVLILSGGALENQSMGPPMSTTEKSHDEIDWAAVTTKLALVNPLDLATNLPSDVAAALADEPSYSELFQRAFGTTEVTPARIAFAIATYQRTLISNQTPFDAFRAGNPNAMTPGQIAGFNAFNSTVTNCNVCHSVTSDQFTDHSFRNIGLRPSGEDLGRQIVTGNTADRGKFKVPSLRNVGLRTRFMHNGQFPTLPAVIGFYARAPGAPVQFTDNRDPVMPTVNAPANIAPTLTDFLQNALTDPRVANETFPFDRPTLFTERPANRVNVIGGSNGRAGTGGFTPAPIISSPPMIGSLDFRIGLQNALAGAPVMLALSFNGPSGGQISPDIVAYVSNAEGLGSGGGYATAHVSLDASGPLGALQPGDIVFAQWFVTDPAAIGGTSFSPVLRIPVFCGSYGCPTVCIADMDFNGGVDGGDIGVFFTYFEAGDLAADLDKNGGVDGGDLAIFFNAFEAGC
jgi:cytochrome c peroxidase